MTAPDHIRIAGKRTIGDWKKTCARLAEADDQDAWRTAYADFFMERLRTRYFAPIEAIDATELTIGEGFSIVAIQCSLIEFLGSTLEGTSYKYRPDKKRPLGQFEYDDSSTLFVRFLITAEPFRNSFSKAVARDFYKNVRCGLLHEARTRNGWTIRSNKAPGSCVDAAAKIIYRRDLQNAFEAFAVWYGAELMTNKGYQDAFIRKFDSLCTD